MNKKAALPVIFLSVLLSSTFVGTIHFGTVQAATNFSGVISADTTWTKANSPYDLAGPARVANGVTLTIKSGATVNLNGYNLEVNGTLVAVGTRTDPISFTLGGSSRGGIVFSQSSTAWNEQASSGSIIMNAVLSGTMLSISSSPKIYNNSIKGAQGVPNTIVINDGSPEIVSNVITFGFESSNTILILGGSPVISNNKITGYTDNGLAGLVGMDTTHMARFGGSIAVAIGGGDVYLSNNEISGGLYGVSVDSGTATIERNLFGTIAYGAIQLSPSVTVSIQNNTFTKDSGGISGVSPLTSINFNNIENTYSYDLQVGQNGTINATNNWWGTTNASAISNKIRDGTVNFNPFLTAANPQALPNATASPLVLPTPPKNTVTTISLSSASILERTSITISGTVDYANSPLADVPVALTAIDPNGNLQNIGTAATDASGIYGTSWTPPIEGTYAITASYAGNQTYSGSNATINLTVGLVTPSPPPSSSSSPSPSQNPTSTPEQTSPQTVSQAEFYGVVVVLAIAVVALLIVIVVLLLRKKP